MSDYRGPEPTTWWLGYVAGLEAALAFLDCEAGPAAVASRIRTALERAQTALAEEDEG